MYNIANIVYVMRMEMSMTEYDPTDSIKEQIASAITARVEELQMSQAQAAACMQLHPSAMCRLVAGRVYGLKLGTLILASERIGVPVRLSVEMTPALAAMAAE